MGPRLVLTALALCVVSSLPAAQARWTSPNAPSPVERGLALHAVHCAVCHGEAGRGDGPAAGMLHPRPRDFGSAAFKIVSTRGGVPHDDDLLQTIRFGMPGSSMPGWDHLSRRDLNDLVAAVRQFMLDARIDAIVEADGCTRAEAVLRAMESLDPRGRLELQREPWPSLERLTRGRDLFVAGCSACHDLDGRARDREDLLDMQGRPLVARDLTRGVFKGGYETEDIVHRILLGIPGTPMPAMRLSEDDAWCVAQYVQSMTDPGRTEAQRQLRRSIVAHRVYDKLDEHLHLDAWDAATEAHVPLMPMVWRRERPETLRVRALHDGRLLALRLTWSDPTRDAGAHDGHAPDDAVAVQFAREFDPPFFGMGAADDSVSMLQWRASWQQEGEAGAVPVLAPPEARVGVDWPVETVAAHGPGRLHPSGQLESDVRARGLHGDGSWDVIILRELAREGGPTLTPGHVTSIGFAVWDGSAGDEAGRKSTTVWHHLLLGE